MEALEPPNSIVLSSAENNRHRHSPVVGDGREGFQLAPLGKYCLPIEPSVPEKLSCFSQHFQDVCGVSISTDQERVIDDRCSASSFNTPRRTTQGSMEVSLPPVPGQYTERVFSSQSLCNIGSCHPSRLGPVGGIGERGFQPPTPG